MEGYLQYSSSVITILCASDDQKVDVGFVKCCFESFKTMGAGILGLKLE